jgi:hypothetical protein
MCSMSCTSPILLIQSPNCRQTVQIMKLFMMQFPPVSSNLLFLRPKYLPRHPPLQHPQPMFLPHVCDSVSLRQPSCDSESIVRVKCVFGSQKVGSSCNGNMKHLKEHKNGSMQRRASFHTA